LLAMFLKSVYGGYSSNEIPVVFRDRRFGQSKLNLVIEAPKFLLRLIRDTVKYRILKGKPPRRGPSTRFH